MSREQNLTRTGRSALILRSNLPESYVSTAQGDRILIARMYEQLYGHPAGHGTDVTVREQARQDDGLGALKSNLATLNEIITEMTAKVSDDPYFTSMTREVLRDHSWRLGFSFQGESPPPGGTRT